MPQSLRFDVPFPAHVSPHREAAREANAEWVTRHGLIPSRAGREEYLSWDLAGAAARIYHRAERHRLIETLNFFSIGFLFDDQFDPALPDRLESVSRAAAELAMIPFRPPGAPTEFACALTEAWAALWPRIAAATSPVWRQRFAGHAARWLTAHVWEARLAADGVQLDVPDYIRLRRRSVGLDHSLDITEWTYGFELPVTAAAHPLLRRLRDATTDTIAFMNDVHSYEREAGRGEGHNLVAVLHHTTGMPLDAALARAASMARDALARFVHLERGLPALGAHLRLSATGYDATRLFVDGMRDWIRGNHDWAVGSGRYRPPRADRGPYEDDLLANRDVSVLKAG